MSFEIVLELGGNPPDWNYVADVLLRAGAEDVDQLVRQDKEELTSFLDSGLLFFAMKYENAPRIVSSAEGNLNACSPRAGNGHFE